MSQYTYCIVTKGIGLCIAIHCCVLQQAALQTSCIMTGLRKKGWAVLQYNTASPGHGRPGAWPCACDTAMLARTHAHDTALARARHCAHDTALGAYDMARHPVTWPGATATTRP